MPPRDTEEWGYDPPNGIREGAEDDAANDVDTSVNHDTLRPQWNPSQN